MSIDQVHQTFVTQGPTVAAGQETVRTNRHRITPLAFFFRGLFALALLAVPSIIAASPTDAATTIAPTTTCGSGLGNLGGRGLICEVTAVNTITASGGSATVTVRECLGSAGDPTDGSGGGGFSCSTKTVVLTEPLTAVTQCNNSINGGGGTLRCSVKITNNFIGVSPGETTATVNQCIGSGASGIVGLNINCNPVKADTGAAITQCNGSANGGTLVGLTCTVTGKTASALPITINQGNGSANGGGALVIGSVILINNALSAPTASPTGGGSATASPTGGGSATASPTGGGSATASPTGGGSATASPTGGGSATASPTASGSDTPGGNTTPPPTSTGSDGSSNNSTPLFPLLILVVSGVLGLALVHAERRSIRR